MLLLPGIAMGIELFKPNGWLALQQWHLVFIGLATMALEIWMIAEALIAWPKAKGVLEPALPSLPGTAVLEPQSEGGRSC
jgi:carbon starvation protein